MTDVLRRTRVGCVTFTKTMDPSWQGDIIAHTTGVDAGLFKKLHLLIFEVIKST